MTCRWRTADARLHMLMSVVYHDSSLVASHCLSPVTCRTGWVLPPAPCAASHCLQCHCADDHCSPTKLHLGVGLNQLFQRMYSADQTAWYALTRAAGSRQRTHTHMLTGPVCCCRGQLFRRVCTRKADQVCQVTAWLQQGPPGQLSPQLLQLSDWMLQSDARIRMTP